MIQAILGLDYIMPSYAIFMLAPSWMPASRPTAAWTPDPRPWRPWGQGCRAPRPTVRYIFFIQDFGCQAGLAENFNAMMRACSSALQCDSSKQAFRTWAPFGDPTLLHQSLSAVFLDILRPGRMWAKTLEFGFNAFHTC